MNIKNLFGRKAVAQENDDSAAATVVQKPFNLEDFFNDLRQLDQQNMGGWPLPVKILTAVMLAVAVIVFLSLIALKPRYDEIAQAKIAQEKLIATYKESADKLKNLNAYKAQLEELEVNYGRLLEQLPKQIQTPELIEGISYAALGSGVRMDDIRIQKEVPKESFIELPFDIKAQGEYHSFGAFFSGVSNLPRIISLHDFSIEPLSKTESKSEVPILSLLVLAKTYRYLDEEKQVDADKKAKEQQRSKAQKDKSDGGA